MSSDVEPFFFSFFAISRGFFRHCSFLFLKLHGFFSFVFFFNFLVISCRKLCKDMFKAWSNLDDSCFVVEKISGGITNLC